MSGRDPSGDRPAEQKRRDLAESQAAVDKAVEAFEAQEARKAEAAARATRESGEREAELGAQEEADSQTAQPWDQPSVRWEDKDDWVRETIRANRRHELDRDRQAQADKEMWNELGNKFVGLLYASSVVVLVGMVLYAIYGALS